MFDTSPYLLDILWFKSRIYARSDLKSFKPYTKLVERWLVRQKLVVVIFFNRFRMNYGLRFESRQLKIVIPERHASIVKNLSRGLLLLSIVFSFAVISPPYSVVVSLLLIVLEQLLERVVFSYIAAVLIEFPSLELWNRAKFLGSYFTSQPGGQTTCTVGMFFANESAAREVFEYVSGWNHGKEDDLGINEQVCVSFVINERKDAYAMFVYPNPEQETLKKYQDALKTEEQHRDKEQIALVGMMIMCKVFPNYSTSGFRVFQNHYRSGGQYLLSPFVLVENIPRPITGAKRILKDRIKIKRVEELERIDIEKAMCEYHVDWDPNEVVPPSQHYIYKPVKRN